MKKLVIKSIPFPTNNVQQFFTPLSQLPWAMLLESASTQHIDSRYHIIVADPVATLTTHTSAHQEQGKPEQTLTTIQRDNITTEYSNEPFELLQQTLDNVIGKVDSSVSELPFLAGALGYFGYDLGRSIEVFNSAKIGHPANNHSIAQDDLDFPDMLIGLYEWAIVIDTDTQQAWQTQYSVDAEQAWLARQQWLIEQGVGVTGSEADIKQEFQLTQDWQSNMSESEYGQKFAQIQAYLRSGDCYQINLAQRFNNQYQGDEWQAYCKLSQYNQAPFSAFIRLPNKAILSISPERFIQLKNGDIETKPIKGTRPRSDDPIQDQANSDALKCAEKDRAENLMIVDLLRNDIGKIAVPGTVSVPHLFAIESFPAVHHLVSTIIGKLPIQQTPAALLRACFPGGSITGAPKIRAMQIIEELEPHRRSLYCGSIGYISIHGTVDTSITIRTLLCDSGEIYCWAGGGIVADSVVTEEYRETYDKLGKILPIL